MPRRVLRTVSVYDIVRLMKQAERRRRMHRYLPKTITLEPEAEDRLQERADTLGCSFSELMRRIADAYLEYPAELERLCPSLRGDRTESVS